MIRHYAERLLEKIPLKGIARHQVLDMVRGTAEGSSNKDTVVRILVNPSCTNCGLKCWYLCKVQDGQQRPHYAVYDSSRLVNFNSIEGETVCEGCRLASTSKPPKGLVELEENVYDAHLLKTYLSSLLSHKLVSKGTPYLNVLLGQLHQCHCCGTVGTKVNYQTGSLFTNDGVELVVSCYKKTAIVPVSYNRWFTDPPAVMFFLCKPCSYTTSQ